MAKEGSIVIDTAINTAGFKQGAKEIEVAAKNAASSAAEIGIKAQVAVNKAVNAFVKQNQAYATQEKKVENLKNKYDELSGQQVETQDFSRLNQQISEAEDKIARLQQRMDDFRAKGGNEGSQAFKGMEIELQRLQGFLAEARVEKEQFLTSGAAYQPVDLSQLTAQIATEEQKLANMGASLNTSFAALQQRLAQYGAQTVRVAAQTTPLQAAFAKLRTSASTVASSIGTKLKQGLKSVGTLAKNAAKSLLGLNKNTSAMNRGFKGGLKQLLRYGIGVESLFALFNRLRTAITEGVKNLAQFDGGTNASASSMKSSLTTLKNSLATAFSPILTVIAPILTKFMTMLAQAATYIGMFVAKLTGATTFTKATAVQEDYAGSLNETADAAKKVEKNLSGLDEMNTWQSADSGGGAGAGANVGNMFEVVEIDKGIGSLADSIKDRIAADDWQGVGELLAEKINSAVASADWQNVGSKIGEKLQNAFELAKGFVSTVNWAGIGGAAATALNGALSEIDFGTITTTISRGFAGMISISAGFIQKLNWRLLAQKCIEGIKGIDFSAIATSFFSMIGLSFGGLSAFLGEVISRAVTECVTYFAPFVEEAGGNVVLGILNGILNAIANIAVWIYDHIFSPFIEGFKKAFGIHSPSTVMQQMGVFIMQGLFNGITSLVGNVVAKFNELKAQLVAVADALQTSLAATWQNVKNTATSIFTGVKTSVVNIFNSLKNAIKTPINGIIGFVNGLVSGIISGINSAIRALNRLKISIPSWVPVYGGKYFGFNLSTLSTPKIPYLASGAVIPPNAPFTAVLGDQRNGTNIETPERLLRQIMREELGNRNAQYKFTAQINRRTLFEEMITEAKLRQGSTGKNPFELA